ncbi:tyrosine-type recombinase/integrase [Dictyobacter aurantiacus]|uniref:tyrosine-type recombinase/integrase n=1 Tax=Dictyobacter aurantiacus TaxID=1936993 RepID=UPI000F81BE35|nr:tyrosine-type recombinase/integrase [Dictyobacter aurantiacus]
MVISQRRLSVVTRPKQAAEIQEPMTVAWAIEAYSYAVLSLSPETQKWYLQKLQVFSDWCTEKDLTLDTMKVLHLRQFTEHLKTRTNPQTGKPLSTYTQHGYTQVVKSFLNWCSKEEDLEDVVSEKLAKRMPMTKVDKKVIEIFTPAHIRALFEACKNEYNEEMIQRDKAILAVLFDTGIRASELCGLTLDHVYLSKSESYLKVFGKGNKWREVPLGNNSKAAIHKYMHRYRDAINQEDHVFLSRAGKPMTASGLLQLFERLGNWGHVRGVRCSPHTARHTFAVTFLTNGGDLYKLSRLMGHTSVMVTENYLRAFQARDARNVASVLDSLK